MQMYRRQRLFLLAEFRIWDFLFAQSEILGFEMWNRPLRNPETHYRLESGIQVPLTKNRNAAPWILNPQSRIQNPRLSWIPFHRRKPFIACLLPLHLPFQIWPMPMKWVHWSGSALDDCGMESNHLSKSSESESFCIDYFVAVARSFNLAT